MIEFHIDKNSTVALYKQLINDIIAAVKDNQAVPGQMIPSMNELSDKLGISKETVKKAYGILRDKSVIEARQGKGFYISGKKRKNNLSVLFLFDKFNNAKQSIVEGFNKTIEQKCKETILIYNQDVKLFEYLIQENLDNFDYYVIAPHFKTNAPGKEKVIRTIRRIPFSKLIIVDNQLNELKGNYGVAYQDFSADAYNCLKMASDEFHKVSRITVITRPSSLYCQYIRNGIAKFGEESNIETEFITGAPQKIRPGEAFFLLHSEPDTGLPDIMKCAQNSNLEVGKDFYIISYNDSPLDSLVLGGLTTISTNFNEMGQEAARMINSRQMRRTHIPFGMKKRYTF